MLTHPGDSIRPGGGPIHHPPSAGGCPGSAHPGPRNPARETISCRPAATSPRSSLVSPALLPRPPKSPHIQRENGGEPRSDPGVRAPTRSQGAIPTDPSLSLSLGRRRRGCNNPRAFAQNRRETGSLGTARSATQSPRCSHSGIARGQLRVFLRVSGDCSGSREGAEEDEARPRQSGGQCAEDRLANRVSWSGFRGIRRQRRTTVRAAQPRAVDRKSLRLRESASQVSRSYPVLSRVQNF